MNPQRMIPYIISLFIILPFCNLAEAVPSFARKTNLECSSCHNALPQLNVFGRRFRENGYKISAQDSSTGMDHENLSLDKHLPISAVLVARPYDEKESSVRKVRALHEAEIMVAGSFSKNFSGFFEIEAEDETGFEPEVPVVAMSYHQSPALNYTFAWAPIMYMDSYDTFGFRRLTISQKSTVDNEFGGADGDDKLQSSRQLISISGRPKRNFFYNVGLSGMPGDGEGEKASNIHARVAFDLMPNIMLGALYIDGSNEVDALDFERTGVDFQADLNNTRVMAALINATDEQLLGSDVDNAAYYLQLQQHYLSGNMTRWVTVLRYDEYEKMDGKLIFTELTLNATYFIKQNVKAMLEFWQQLDREDGVDEDSRVTAQVVVGF